MGRLLVCIYTASFTTLLTNVNDSRAPYYVQGAQKKSIPVKIFGSISPMIENFKIKFYTPFICSYLRKITKFYSIISNFDTVMPY